MNTLGDNLKKYRISMKLSQDEVAKKVNKARETYSRYETGTLVPDIETLVKLADLYCVSLDVLTGRISTFDQWLSRFMPCFNIGTALGDYANRKRVTKRMKKEAATSGDGAKSGS